MHKINNRTITEKEEGKSVSHNCTIKNINCLCLEGRKEGRNGYIARGKNKIPAIHSRLETLINILSHRFGIKTSL
jgi:hypothetical protein